MNKKERIDQKTEPFNDCSDTYLAILALMLMLLSGIRKVPHPGPEIRIPILSLIASIILTYISVKYFWFEFKHRKVIRWEVDKKYAKDKPTFYFFIFIRIIELIAGVGLFIYSLILLF